jgi:DNA-binding MarR family transcriptional regulator
VRVARAARKKTRATESQAAVAAIPIVEDFPLELSIGAQVKLTQRLLSRTLQSVLLPYDIPIGMWYFLRAMWQEDGMTQREISRRVGATAPTSVEQLRNMEARGLVARRPSQADRRKVHFFLTEEAIALKGQLMTVPQEIDRLALNGLSPGEIGFLRLALRHVQKNLERNPHIEFEDAEVAVAAQTSRR